MSTPPPRPALRKAADAHIHPAAPGHSLHALRPSPDDGPTVPTPRTDVEAVGPTRAKDSTKALVSPGGGDSDQHRLSGPLRGTTSDTLRSAARKAHRHRRSTDKRADKAVDLGVKVPKNVRKEFRAAVRADKRDPDVVVTALLKAWLGT